MKIIMRPRGQGKTTELLYTSEVTDYRIICSTQQEKESLKRQALELNLFIPTPMTCKEYLCGRGRRGLKDKGIMIDNVEMILPEILTAIFEVPVEAITMSIPQTPGTFTIH